MSILKIKVGDEEKLVSVIDDKSCLGVEDQKLILKFNGKYHTLEDIEVMVDFCKTCRDGDCKIREENKSLRKTEHLHNRLKSHINDEFKKRHPGLERTDPWDQLELLIGCNDVREKFSKDNEILKEENKKLRKENEKTKKFLQGSHSEYIGFKDPSGGDLDYLTKGLDTCLGAFKQIIREKDREIKDRDDIVRDVQIALCNHMDLLAIPFQGYTDIKNFVPELISDIKDMQDKIVAYEKKISSLESTNGNFRVHIQKLLELEGLSV